MSTSEETDPNAIVTLLLSIGALGLSVVGGVISVFAIGTGGFTAAGVLGLIAAGAGIVYSVASMIYSIFACIDFERDFFGLIINDTKYDMLIEGRFQNYEHNDKERVGVYLKHGDLSAIVYDSDENGNNYKTYIKNNLTDGKDGAFMGIFKFSKTPFPNTVGSEGIIRMKGNNRFIDVFAACPASNDNRMMISCQYSNNDLKRADEAMYKQCGGKSPYVESNGNLYLKSAVNSFSDSPTWGIASVSEI